MNLMLKEIKAGSNSPQGKAVLYAGMLGLILSDIIPTPADALYFYTEAKLRDQWKEGKITPKQYWTRETLAYYGYNPLYWAIIAGITVAIPGNVHHKLRIGAALIGTGAVGAVIAKQYQADQRKYLLSQPLPPKE